MSEQAYVQAMLRRAGVQLDNDDLTALAVARETLNEWEALVTSMLEDSREPGHVYQVQTSGADDE